MLRILNIIWVILALTVGFTILFVSVLSTLKQQQQTDLLTEKAKYALENKEEIMKLAEENNHEETTQTGNRGREKIARRNTDTEAIRQKVEEVFQEEEAVAWANYIIMCESSFNPAAVSSNGLYFGLFQFHPGTFLAYQGIDINNWGEQIEVAKRMYDLGLQHHWPACNNKYQTI